MEINSNSNQKEMISKLYVSNPPEKKAFTVENLDWDNLKGKIKSFKKPRNFFAKTMDICIGICTTSFLSLIPYFPFKNNFAEKPIVICVTFIFLFTSLFSAIICGLNSSDQKKQSEISIDLLLKDMKTIETKGGRIIEKENV